MTDISEAVTAGVTAYADAEAALTSAHDALLRLPAAYAAAFAASPAPPTGDVQPLGYIESQGRANAARRLAGKVADALQDVLVRHQDDTDRCKALGIDLPMPGAVHPDGGTR